MKIKSIQLEYFKRKLWTDKYGIITLNDSTKWAYNFEYDEDVWIDVNDYLDNVKSDFINESNSGIETSELFSKYESLIYEENKD